MFVMLWEGVEGVVSGDIFVEYCWKNFFRFYVFKSVVFGVLFKMFIGKV